MKRIRTPAMFGVITAISSGFAYPQAAPSDFNTLVHDADIWLGKDIRENESDRAEVQSFDQRLNAIDPLTLSNEEDQLNYAVLRKRMDQWVTYFHPASTSSPFGPFWGIQRSIESVQRHRRVTTIPEFKEYLREIDKLPQMIDRDIELMRQALTNGTSLPRSTMVGVTAEIKRLVETKVEPLQHPLGTNWNELPAAERDQLWRKLHAVHIPGVTAALSRLHTFLNDEYLPKTRDSIGISAIEGGSELYSLQLREHGDTAFTPEQLHSLGLQEVDRIWRLVIDCIKMTDWFKSNPDFGAMKERELFDAFREHLRIDPQFYHSSNDAVLQAYRNASKIVDLWLPTFFKRLPRLPFGVLPTTSSGREAGVVGYQLGNLEKGIVSVFTIELKQLQDHPKFAMTPWTLHEASPGHHLQMALADEEEGWPRFRRTAWFTAYGEGWAMYAETLGYDMHLYDDPYARFGQLHSELHRACRLVIDPGIHALGWSRQQATQYLADRTLLTEQQIEQEINRYIAWPAQAISYTLGGMRIKALRAKAESELGVKFDIREFHDVVLSAGAIPLNVLERRVNEWIAGQVRSN